MKALTILALASVSMTTMAADNIKTVCSHGDQVRIIEVVYTEGSEVPCEVHYTKAEGTEVLWSAQNLVGYCEEKAVAFADKQRGWGWTCAQADAMASTDEAVLGTATAQ